MPESTETPHAAPRTVGLDLPCAGCRYNLRGLDADGPCVECGLPVFRSFEQDRLIFAAPRWLAHVRRGCIVLTLTPPLTVIVTVAVVAWVELTAPSYRSGAIFGRFVPGVMCTALWAVVLGVWLATRPDTLSRPRRGLRWAARLGALVPCVFFSSMLLEPVRRMLDRFFTAVSPEYVIPTLLVACALALLVGVAGVIAALAHRARPARGLGRWAVVNQTLALPLLALTAGVGVLAEMSRRGVSLASDRSIDFLTVCMALAWAAAGLSMLGLCVACAVALRREARAALDPAYARPPVPSAP